MKFKPYKKYKKVDLPWIDEIPSHWEVVKNRKLWNERNERGFIDKELISVTISNGIIKQEDLLKNTFKRDTSNLDKSRYKLIKKNDIAYNTMRMWQGAVGLSPYEGIVSPAYIVLEPKSNMNYKYYHYLLRTDEYNNESYRNSYGICDDQLKLRYEDFKVMTNIFPPKEEQDKIADFLDHNLAKIDKFVELTERQIELLKDQKEVIINDAVTKGIDKDVAYKDSGVDWIGEIPEHWEVTKLKYLTNNSFLYGANESGIEYDSKLPRYIRITDIDKNGILKNTGKRSLNNEKSKGFLLNYGDILFARSGATVGKTFLYEYKNNKACFAGYLIRFRPDFKKIIPKYLYFYTKSGLYKLWVQSVFVQSTIQNISAERYKDLIITLPSKKDQEKIVNYIEKETNKIDRTIELYKNQIELIKEYRTSLIASAVTGKIDVRDF